MVGLNCVLSFSAATELTTAPHPHAHDSRLRNQWKESERRRRRGVVSIFLPLTHLAIATVLFCHRSEPDETSSERGLSV